MTDHETTFQEVKSLVKAFVDERDWDQFHHPKELAISLALEAAELLEVFQWQEKEPIEQFKSNPKMMDKIREELADIIIYCLNLANKTGLDVSDIIKAKLKVNAEKYPIDKAKGSNKKYTEL